MDKIYKYARKYMWLDVLMNINCKNIIYMFEHVSARIFHARIKMNSIYLSRNRAKIAREQNAIAI